MRTALRLFLLTFILLLPLISSATADYYPPRGNWQRAAPQAVGMDADRLAEAIALARSKAVVEPSDLAQAITDSFSPREPDFRILGPTKPREGSSGLVIRKGYIVAEWGDLERVDMTFSAVKSYLSTIMALALRDGLVDDVHAPVSRWVRDGKFASEHNRGIAWHHLMNQTSDWQGTLWDVPDWADRPEGEDRALWPNRELHEPGSYFKYNDVRINLAAYSLLQVWRQPLPVVLKREIMDPIGASTTWRWHGYENSWVTLDGQKIQSVSGGGHFGGGLFINTLDHARMGLLFLRNGNWQDKQIVPTDWINAMRQPTPVKPDYGYMWWLNTGQEQIPAAPETAFWAAGFGGNYIYVDQENDLLVVLRWVPPLADVVTAIMSAIED
jgi:CubicO group peptidase (beta-lactamase class C family)